MKVPASKEEGEDPESKYFDRGLLPIIIESGGSRRRRKSRSLESPLEKIKENLVK
jgi:hypothetical protein